VNKGGCEKKKSAWPKDMVSNHWGHCSRLGTRRETPLRAKKEEKTRVKGGSTTPKQYNSKKKIRHKLLAMKKKSTNERKKLGNKEEGFALGNRVKAGEGDLP